MYVSGNGYLSFSNAAAQTFIVPLGTVSSTAVTTSFVAGPTLTVTAANGGFATGNDYISDNLVTVCGFKCPVTSATGTSLQCKAPALATKYIRENLPAQQ